jgi:hypothetical protein
MPCLPPRKNLVHIYPAKFRREILPSQLFQPAETSLEADRECRG